MKFGLMKVNNSAHHALLSLIAWLNVKYALLKMFAMSVTTDFTG
jgi:hypothetical protein